MGDYCKLRVWQDADRLVLRVYEATAGFPMSERFGLTSQLRRAAVSIPTNIAEGCGRNMDGDFARFLRISLGSASEVQYLLSLATRLKLLDESTWNSLDKDLQSIKSQLASLVSRLKPAPRMSDSR